jgi:cytochrome c
MTHPTVFAKYGYGGLANRSMREINSTQLSTRSTSMKETFRMNGATLAVTAMACALLSVPAVSVAATDAAPLAAKYNCTACHSADKKVVGPSYKEIAAKYAGDSGAAQKLVQKVKNGGSGVWGTVPMPPNNVPDADLKALVDWILATK